MIPVEIGLVVTCKNVSLSRFMYFLLSLSQIKTLGDTNPVTNLVPDLSDIDLDAAYSSVPYEKGFALLFHLEQLLGGPGRCWSDLK